jgi:hypothetical protein
MPGQPARIPAAFQRRTAPGICDSASAGLLVGWQDFFVAAIEDNGDGTVDIVVSFHNRDGTYRTRSPLHAIVNLMKVAQERA